MESVSHRCNRVCRRRGCASTFTPRTDGLAVVLLPIAETEWLALYYIDQNQSGGTSYQVTQTQAQAMKAAGRGRFINRGKAFQLCELAPVRLKFTCSMSTDSSASISPSEMEANVGITPNNGSPNEPALRHIVTRAQQKVRAIGRRLQGTFDPRAALAFGAPSWPVSRG